MARPRVFISSTFYDFRQVRADLDRFIRGLGYEAVLNEKGLIPYGKDQALEEYCYREIITVDVLIAIVGGRFGTNSQHNPYSISQQEIKTALENGKPVFIFIQRDVLAEFDTYKQNKENDTVQYAAVSDKRVYAFLEELYALPNNNPIAAFERAEDITDYLREQWAGLFQRFLTEETRRQEAKLIGSLAATTATLNQLVQLLSEEKRGSDAAVREILLTTHPIFEQIRKLTNTPYRIFFTNRYEFEQWAKARSFGEVDVLALDKEDYEEWSFSVRVQGQKTTSYLHIYRYVFDDDGKLRIYTPSEWNPDWVYVTTVDVQANEDNSPPF